VLAMLVGRRTTMSERVQAGLSRARAQGKTLGRPKPAVRLERVLALRAKGLSLHADAARGARGDGKFTITPFFVQNALFPGCGNPEAGLPKITSGCATVAPVNEIGLLSPVACVQAWGLANIINSPHLVC
jgi:hypothetical protein